MWTHFYKIDICARAPRCCVLENTWYSYCQSYCMFSLNKAKATDTLRNGSSWLRTYGFWSWHPMSCSSIVHGFDARSHRHSTSAGRSVLKYFPEAQSLRCFDHLRASHLRKKGAYINPLGYAVGSVGILLGSPNGFPSVPTSNTRRSWPNMVASETFPSGKCIATYETLWRVFCSLFLIASITDHTNHQTRVDTCGQCLDNRFNLPEPDIER